MVQDPTLLMESEPMDEDSDHDSAQHSGDYHPSRVEKISDKGCDNGKPLPSGDYNPLKEELEMSKLSKSEMKKAQPGGDSHPQREAQTNFNPGNKNAAVTPGGDPHPQQDDHSVRQLFSATRNRNKILDPNYNWEYDNSAWAEAKEEIIEKANPPPRTVSGIKPTDTTRHQSKRHEENEQTPSTISLKSQATGEKKKQTP